MKKKLVIMIILFLISLTFLIENICKISLYDSVKEIIIGQEKMSSNYEKEYTTIDVTNLEDNSNLEHEHLMKTMYDENAHWKECTVCGKKEEENVHTYKTTWALGNESCHYTNSYTNTCECGYSYIGHKPCIWDGTSYISDYNLYNHTRKCSKCGTYINYEYYYNGILYSDKQTEGCILSNNNIISCSNLGRCQICRYNYTQKIHTLTTIAKAEEPNIITAKCISCDIEFAEFYTYDMERDNNVPGTYTYRTHVTLKNGAKYYSINSTSSHDKILTTRNITQLESKSADGTEIILKTNATFLKTTKEGYDLAATIYISINGLKNWLWLEQLKMYPDNIEPEITNITMEKNEELTMWSKVKPITITGTENYCNTVKVKIIDDENNIIFEGGGTVNSNQYSVQCIPEIECDTNGRTFTAIVTDACENSTSKEFTIARVDAIPPKPISDNKIEKGWSKSKKVTFKAIDKGIGNVQIAFNDIKDLQLAKNINEEYLREYEFIGDVYKEKELSVLYKDELGNTSIQKITIDKLDNTAPSITNTSIHNDIITIKAHDRHETLGEGSGVVKYRYLASEEKLTNPELTEETSIESENKEIKIKDIHKVKYIYVIAEDYVGNTSKVYEFKVPELILTSSVNLNTEDRKGEIILDWSSYDVLDKYFVVYRKKENQADWEKIVPLTQKLTGSTYTDRLGNDEVKPEIPNIIITGDESNNNINITPNSIDNGTNYKYYIESYDNTGTLISKSN